MNTNEKGGLGESRLIYEFTKKGWKVSLPLGHDAAYDMVVDDGEHLHRVQVKSVESSDDVVLVRTERTYTSGERIVTRRYSKSDFDLLGVFDRRGDKCYLIPVWMVADKSCISLRLTAPKNNQKKGILLADDFEVK